MSSGDQTPSRPNVRSLDAGFGTAGSLGADSGAAPNPAQGAEDWDRACHAAALLAVDPVALSGILVASAYSPVRTAWLGLLRTLLGEDMPVRQMPGHIDAGRLLGGLDLAATLAAGRPVIGTGVLASADGGVVVVPSAERLPRATDAMLAAVRDVGGVDLQRDGISLWTPTRFGLVVLDESADDSDHRVRRTDERVSMRITLDHVDYRTAEQPRAVGTDTITTARILFPEIIASADDIAALCTTASALGIQSVRAPLMALAVARANAALAGRRTVTTEDLEVAALFALGWRATQLPAPAEETAPQPRDTAAPPNTSPPSDADASPETDQAETSTLDERLVDAARCNLPHDLLASLAGGTPRMRQPAGTGQSGTVETGIEGPERIGTRGGDPRRGGQLSIYATLLAAAPHQRFRQGGNRCRSPGTRSAIHVRPEDFRIFIKRRRKQSLTIFAVDASGSQALHRLGEAKGAVELLLSECYVRRDQIALIAFRGAGAQLLLPPTSALARAKRSLAVLPGGGGTPLASGLRCAATLAQVSQRSGQTPSVVVLTDGRANIARDGTANRTRATEDAFVEATHLRRLGVRSLMIDTSPFPDHRSSALAAALGATYLALPKADAGRIKSAISAG